MSDKKKPGQWQLLEKKKTGSEVTLNGFSSEMVEFSRTFFIFFVYLFLQYKIFFFESFLSQKNSQKCLRFEAN